MTDQDELIERLWDAITEIRDDFPRSHRDAPTTLLIDSAILPIIEAEVRKAQVDALRDAAEGWRQSQQSPQHTVRMFLYNRATDIEQED